jgi:Flp pilus assembly pilin Flp
MKAIKKFMKQKVSGIGIIEIILILVIIIGLILIFRTQIEAIIQTAFSSINSNADAINGEITLTTP